MRISDWSSDVCSSDLGRRVGFAADEWRRRAGQRCIQGDGRKLAAQQCLLAMQAQFRAGLRGAAEAQVGDLVDALEQRVEAVEVGQQHRRGLGADAGHTGDVVDRVAAQRQVVGDLPRLHAVPRLRSEEHTSELQSLMRISYAVFCLKKKITTLNINTTEYHRHK